MPFASPPQGELRWKAPRDPEPWPGERRADEFSSACPQFGGLMGFVDPDTLGQPAGDEDCLYLNVWRPRSDQENLPVFFWIHGGGNFAGQANMRMYHGANFAGQANMVFVSVNYRLGPMGWFSHPALQSGDVLDDSGNYGTLDLIKALTWVQHNIAAFGGDPDNVTIAGQSAGAINVYSLLVSPLARGLMHRAILQSGFPLSMPMEGGKVTADIILARLLIRDGLVGNLLEVEPFILEKGEAWVAGYLRSKEREEIFSCLTPGMAGAPMETAGSITGVLEDGTVIPGKVSVCLENGDYAKVPLILGCNQDEAKIFLPLIVSKKDEKGFCQLIQEFDPDHPDLALDDLLSDPWISAYGPLADTLNGFFPSLAVDSVANILSFHQQDIYVYEFAWDEEPEPLDYLIGAGHALEIPFVFSNFSRHSDSLFRFAWSEGNREGREKLSETMLSYWAQFARTGTPELPGQPRWHPWSNMVGAPERIILGSDELRVFPVGQDEGLPWREPYVEGMDGVENLVFDGEGLLFVSGLDGTVYRIEPTADPFRGVIAASKKLGEMCLGIEIGPDGMIYVGVAVTSLDMRIMKVSKDLSQVTVLTDSIPGLNGFVTDREGYLYYTSSNVNPLSPRGEIYRVRFGDDDNFSNPETVVHEAGMVNGLAFAPDESILYYSETTNGVWAFDRATEEKEQLLALPGFLDMVDDLTVAPDGTVWFCLNSRRAVVPLEKGRLTGAGYQVGSIGAPSSCAFGKGPGFRSDFLYITEFGQKALSLTKDGRGLWVFPVEEIRG